MQHDYVIDNGPGLAVRTDMNEAVQALNSNNAGPVEPQVPYANMIWLDTSQEPAVFRLRTAANDDWTGEFRFATKVSTPGTVEANSFEALSQNALIGRGGHTIISNEQSGNVYLRPVGFGDATNQAYLRGDNGRFVANYFQGNGSLLTALNASQLTSGTVPTGRLSGTYTISISGSAGSATTATNCSRSVVAGNGLTGGGQLTANRTLSVGAGTGISVASNSVGVSADVWRDGNPPSAAQVGNAMAGLGAGVVGSYAMAQPTKSGDSGNYLNPGSTFPGSSLRWSNAGGNAGTALSGSWRVMSRPDRGASGGDFRTGIFLRYA